MVRVQSNSQHARALRVAGAQLDLVVGDIDGNIDRILDAMGWAQGQNADVLLLPEMAISGYPPEDLLLDDQFVQACATAIEKLAANSGRCLTIVGFPRQVPAAVALDGRPRSLTNSVVLLRDGQVQGCYDKRALPNYAVFDEARYFSAGVGQRVCVVNDRQLGLGICEDLWDDPYMNSWDTVELDVLLVVNASPYDTTKQATREQLVSRRAQQLQIPVVYLNLVGGQDELVFDGASLVADRAGRIAYRAASFEQDRFLVQIDRGQVRPVTPSRPQLVGERQIWGALQLGLGDYITKGGIPQVIIGLSGGIDSALVATLAADTLGPSRVWGIAMPGPYSSEGSVTDAQELADRLGILFDVLPIGDAYAASAQVINRGTISRFAPGITEQNLQARVRGMTLMALSNRYGGIVLTTSNKSESSVGYFTIAGGDSSGGFAPIRDIPKTMVYKLARWRNAQAAATGQEPPIPQSTLDKPPSAELAQDQQDSDDLPPYAVLDPILEAYIERAQPPATIVNEIVRTGLVPDQQQARELVGRVVTMVDRAEFKRRQVPIGVRISPLAFGRDRRLPIVTSWQHQLRETM